ncbi:MAG: putative nucleotide-binding protein containing TIR-like domain protein [Syntrophorhabdus sp. PtaB.Bin184]|nr:MAG: putative nucleotide-binding protein containing TIR-like domain protein [Syntrophorhabdus sp. PtaB.Bin184]
MHDNSGTTSTSATAIILGLHKAEAFGTDSLKDFEKKGLCFRFLHSARFQLVKLYGTNAPIVTKFSDAIKNLKYLTHDQYLSLFQQFQNFLKWFEFFSGQGATTSKSYASPPPVGKNVFIIHGRDETNTLRLRLLLKDYFHLNPVLMMERPGMSRALLEKYEDAASTCVMAFALMTRDDLVGNHGADYLQARPNVIFEVGWFVGRLGIARVCLLLQEGTTVHSDIDGISRVHFRDNIEERVIDIERELQVTGLI